LQRSARFGFELLWGKRNEWTPAEQFIKELTNVTIDRSPNHHVIVPQNRVDALHQASKATPEHQQAGARIPSYTRMSSECVLQRQ
jgi:hypothetical protein